MKKFLGFLCTFLVLFSVSVTVSADSPITPTPFSKAYYDNELVLEARDQGVMNSDFAAYLADDNNPIDVKAAIINALSWDIDGKNNADTYCQLIYSSSLQQLDVTTLSADQQFCIGYLLALDNYNDTTQAMEYLRSARSSMNDSLTVAVVTYLVETMNALYDNWPAQLEVILSDDTLNKDMSEDAIQIITDYMILGIDNPVEKPADIPKTGEIILWGIFAVGAVIAAAGIIFTTVKKKKEEK